MTEDFLKEISHLLAAEALKDRQRFEILARRIRERAFERKNYEVEPLNTLGG